MTCQHLSPQKSHCSNQQAPHYPDLIKNHSGQHSNPGPPQSTTPHHHIHRTTSKLITRRSIPPLYPQGETRRLIKTAPRQQIRRAKKKKNKPLNPTSTTPSNASLTAWRRTHFKRSDTTLAARHYYTPRGTASAKSFLVHHHHHHRRREAVKLAPVIIIRREVE